MGRVGLFRLPKCWLDSSGVPANPRIHSPSDPTTVLLVRFCIARRDPRSPSGPSTMRSGALL